MADKTYQVNRNRILEEFCRLVGFDSESFGEREIADYLKKKLRELGLRVEEDNAREKLLAENPARVNATSNIYAYLDGTDNGEPLLFSSHMDTVSPGRGKRAVVHEDDLITSAGDTVLGADDVSGLVSILEALTVIQENKLSHPPIEVLFTMAEEPYCEGSRYVEFQRLHARMGYVLDLVGPVGRAANAAPSIVSLRVGIKGRAAHAGFSPEKGVNALSIAADALANIRTGRVGEDLTVNFGLIQGGSGRNIVPENIQIEGEIRCLEHERAMCEAELIRSVFEKSAKKYGGIVECIVTEHIRSYHVGEEKPVVRRFLAAAGETARCQKPECITTYGGSDANRLNENQIETIVLACAMENCHGTDEYTSLRELEKSAELTLKLMTL